MTASVRVTPRNWGAACKPTVQLAPGARVIPTAQALLVTAKSLLPTRMPWIVIDAVPSLVTLTWRVTPLVPVWSSPKSI